MAVRFDADGEDYVRTVTIGSTSTFSLCFWAKLSVDRNNYSTFLCLDDDSTSDLLVIGASSDGTTLFISTEAAAEDLTALTVGTWYFVGVSVNASTTIVRLRAQGAGSFTSFTPPLGSGTTDITRLRLGNPCTEPSG
ncbi:hypothetical protein ACIBKY_26770 [Nonomuraea sp. NPDC050394]|uniref:hypothetical protein n=1 Tax=Nonomuraea sp. NPDC050394 TaxID=3364363 RepID=UPI0037AB3506